MRASTACLLLLTATATTAVVAQPADDTPYAASRLVGRWRTVMNRELEDERAFAPETVTDLMEEFVSPGAVRAVRDKAGEAQLVKADDVLKRFVAGMTKAGERRPDGSVVLDESTIAAGRRSICPVYPFCE